MILQKFMKKRKLELSGFKVTVRSLPNVPIPFGLDSPSVSRSNYKVKLTIPITEDTSVTAIYREKGCIERIFPAPCLCMGEYVEGSYDFIILRTRDKVIVRSR